MAVPDLTGNRWMDNLIRRTKYAKQMGVTADTVDNWLDAEKFGLKRVKIGFSVYVDVSGFDPENPGKVAAVEAAAMSEADLGRKI